MQKRGGWPGGPRRAAPAAAGGARLPQERAASLAPQKLFSHFSSYATKSKDTSFSAIMSGALWMRRATVIEGRRLAKSCVAGARKSESARRMIVRKGATGNAARFGGAF